MTSTALACLRAADREETTRANEVVNVSINPRISTKIRLIFKRSSFIIPDYLLFSSSSYLREVFIVNWNYFPLKCEHLEINEYYDISTIRSTFFEFHIQFHGSRHFLSTNRYACVSQAIVIDCIMKLI